MKAREKLIRALRVSAPLRLGKVKVRTLASMKAPTIGIKNP